MKSKEKNFSRVAQYLLNVNNLNWLLIRKTQNYLCQGLEIYIG